MNAFSSSHNPIRTINLYVNKMALADKLLLFSLASLHVVIINIILVCTITYLYLWFFIASCIWGNSTNKECLIIFHMSESWYSNQFIEIHKLQKIKREYWILLLNECNIVRSWNLWYNPRNGVLLMIWIQFTVLKLIWILNQI